MRGFTLEPQGATCGHVQVVLSCVGAEARGGFSLGDLLGGEGAALRDPKREAALAEGGVPYTLVRAGAIFQILYSQIKRTVQ